MKKSPIIFLIITLLLFGCSNSPIVTIVQRGYFDEYRNKTIGQAFNNFFGSPSWKYFLAKDGGDIVEFNGKATLDGNPVKVKIQFSVDKKGGAFEVVYFAVNDLPQNMLTFASLQATIYGQST